MLDWGPDHVGDLVALTDAAMADEQLTSDELLACCWEDPGTVLGSARREPGRCRPCSGTSATTPSGS